jgi:hypothetical protein
LKEETTLQPGSILIVALAFEVLAGCGGRATPDKSLDVHGCAKQDFSL